MNKNPATACRQLLVKLAPRSARPRWIAVNTTSLELSRAEASANSVDWSGDRVPIPCSNRWHVVLGMPALAASSVSVNPFRRRKSIRLGVKLLPNSKVIAGTFNALASLGMKLGWGCSRSCSQAPTRAPSATFSSAATSRKVRPAFSRAFLNAAPSTRLLATNGNPTGLTRSRGNEQVGELAALKCPSDAVLVAYMCEGRPVRPGDGLSPTPRDARNGDDVMDEYEELVRSLVAERFSRSRPSSPNGEPEEQTERQTADTDSPTPPGTEQIRDRIHNNQTNTTEKSER